MAKFVRFTTALMSTSGPTDQSVYINPEHVRVVRVNYEYGGSSAIEMHGQEILVREDLDNVIKALSSAPRT
jgi:hypothetical protein